MQTVFEAAGGNDGLRCLADAWHRRVMADDVVAHAFSHGFHPQHVERLAAYRAEALGGPTTYSDSYGDETTVVKMHSGNGEHDEMDRRAIACFDQALADVGRASPVRAGRPRGPGLSVRSGKRRWLAAHSTRSSQRHVARSDRMPTTVHSGARSGMRRR